jgi:hypothetical protein
MIATTKGCDWPAQRSECNNNSYNSYRYGSGGTMANEWIVKDLIEALKRFPLEAKVYYEMGPNGPGAIGKAQYVNVWGDDEMGVLLDR